MRWPNPPPSKPPPPPSVWVQLHPCTPKKLYCASDLPAFLEHPPNPIQSQAETFAQDSGVPPPCLKDRHQATVTPHRSAGRSVLIQTHSSTPAKRLDSVDPLDFWNNQSPHEQVPGASPGAGRPTMAVTKGNTKGDTSSQGSNQSGDEQQCLQHLLHIVGASLPVLMLRCMAQWYNDVHITWVEVCQPGPLEKEVDLETGRRPGAVLFCNHVRELMGKTLNIPLAPLSFADHKLMVWHFARGCLEGLAVGGLRLRAAVSASSARAVEWHVMGVEAWRINHKAQDNGPGNNSDAVALTSVSSKEDWTSCPSSQGCRPARMWTQVPRKDVGCSWTSFSFS